MSIFFPNFPLGPPSISSASLSVLLAFHRKYQIFINKNNVFFKILWQHQQLRYIVFSIISFPFFFFFFVLCIPSSSQRKHYYPGKYSRILAITPQPNLTNNLSQFHGSPCLSDWDRCKISSKYHHNNHS